MARSARLVVSPWSRGRRRWPLVGLLLALALLGHAGLMAGNVHAAPLHHSAAEPAGEPAVDHHAGLPNDPPPSKGGCEAGPVAAPRLEPGVRLDPTLAPSVAALDAVATLAAPAPAAPPPPPPGIRRALLQVFLI